MDNYYFQMIFTAKGSELDTLQVLARAFIVFTYCLIVFRMAKKRFLGKGTAFDVVMGIVLGSVISRSINGSAKLYPTLAVGLLFIAYHWGVSYIVSKSDLMSKLFEGIPYRLMHDGKLDKHAMDRTHTREIDILEAARLTAHETDIDKISEAYIENSGKIAVIPKEKKSK